MPNASDDWGYDPIDGRPSVTDSPTPYPTFPQILSQSSDFFKKIKTTDRKIWPNQLHPDLHGLVAAKLPLFPDDEIDIDRIAELHPQVFEGLEPTLISLFRAYILGTPFIVVYGRSQLRNDKDETLTINWTVVSRDIRHQGSELIASKMTIDEQKYQDFLANAKYPSVTSLLHVFYNE